MTDTPQALLAHHLKALKLPTFLREYDKLARQCATDAVDHVRYLLRLAELELIERERRMVERRVKEARFPAVKSLDSFDFLALPSLNKTLVLELARSEYVLRRENVIAVGNSGTGKSHVALGLGLAACQKGLSVGFTTAAAVVHELIEARDEKRLLRLQRQLAGYKLLVIDELGYVPLSQIGAELLFEVFSQRYERGSTIVTSNLPFVSGPACSPRRTCGDATPLDRRVSRVRVVDPHHPLYGECYPVSERRSGRGPGLIVIRLADGRERSIPRSATAPASIPNGELATPRRHVHISVRTLLPLANPCALCSPPEMRISKAAVDETSSSRPRGRTETPGMPPDLWLRLPVATRRQLAQQVGQLVQRLRLRSVRSEEGDRADHDVVDR